MVIGIIGESCVGKTTFALKLCNHLNADVFSGKDYLRFAKSESNAKLVFQNKLKEAATSKETHIIYTISEKEGIRLLPENSFRVVIDADLETIYERFAMRMHGNLPSAVAQMLKKKHGLFDYEPCCLRIVSEKTDLNIACNDLLKIMGYEFDSQENK